jgi:hypothetical protein
MMDCRFEIWVEKEMVSATRRRVQGLDDAWRCTFELVDTAPMTGRIEVIDEKRPELTLIEVGVPVARQIAGMKSGRLSPADLIGI